MKFKKVPDQIFFTEKKKKTQQKKKTLFQYFLSSS